MYSYQLAGCSLHQENYFTGVLFCNEKGIIIAMAYV